LEQLDAAIEVCELCPRLVAWRQEVARTKRRAYLDWTYWGRPVPGWGDPAARLLMVGLAPGAHGANRTGRPFTGDGSGDFLFAALHRAGFANQPTSTHRDDGLSLTDCYMAGVARCVPPKNKPNAQELDNCRPFLVHEIGLLPNVQVVLCLGRLAFDGYLRILRQGRNDLPRLAFGHGVHYELDADTPKLLASYHPSLQNTNTGRLTAEMMDDVFGKCRALLTD